MKFGGPGALIVSHRFWRTHLHADKGAIGKTIRLDSNAYTVAGIMPASFRFLDREVDVFEPSLSTRSMRKAATLLGSRHSAG